MSAFTSPDTTAVGTKGSDVYTASGVGDARVALSVLLTRGVDKVKVKDGVETIVAMRPTDDHDPVLDAFLLAFQTRDVRGGKGERDASEAAFEALLKNSRTAPVARELLKLVPEYGSWRDLFQIDVADAKERILDLAVKQFLEDEEALKKGEASVSLLGKWVPREDRGREWAVALAKRLWAASSGRPDTQFSTVMKAYRKRVVALNKHLQTVEMKMCANNWEEIDPAKVPGRASKKYVRAFLNEVVAKKGEYVDPETLRHPDDPVRMKCRERFQEYNKKTATGEVKAKGSDTVFPHEVIRKVYAETHSQTEDEKNHLRGVWRSIVEKTRAGGGLGRSLAMCDFSGSMQSSGSNGASPYWVSMALGLLISECTTEDFKNRILTFDSNPTYHTFPSDTEDVFQKIESLKRNSGIGQGLSTDFQKAMDLVLKTLKEKRTRPGQEPENLIVLTDMNWDAACGSHEASLYTGNSYRHHVKTAGWQTHVEMIRESFKRAGEDMWGEGNGFQMPRIVIWNLAATSGDFHAKADTDGVVMLAGWSPTLFKVLQEEGVKVQTPYMGLRAQLDDARYDAVRKAYQECVKLPRPEWGGEETSVGYGC